MRYLIFTYILVASLYAMGESTSGDPAIGTLGLDLSGATGTGVSGATSALGLPATGTSALGTGTSPYGSAVNPYPYGTGTANTVGIPGTAGLGGVTAYGGNQLTANDAAGYDPTAGQILIDPNDPATYARICPSICARMGQANNPTCLANCVGSVVPGLQPRPSLALDDQLLPLLLALVANDPAPPPPPVDIFVQLPPIPENHGGKNKH
jgi:hypothetical protein